MKLVKQLINVLWNTGYIATCNKNVNLSSIAEHFNLYHNSHILSKDKPLLSLKIIDRANNYTERKIKEVV